MGELGDRMAADLDLRAYSSETCDAYLRYAKNYAEYFMRSPADMGEEQIREYLLYLVQEKKAGPSTVRMSVAALKFLYTHTLDRPEEFVRIPWPKAPKPLPTILSGAEVLRLLESFRSLKHRMVAMTAYGAGLRISEICRLQLGDIDSDRMLLHVRNGKRGRARYVMLPERLHLCLRTYWKEVRPPGPYLFPGRAGGGHIGVTTVQYAVRKAARAAGISKRVTPHVLRASFATHLLEAGSDIRTIQVLLGHRSIRSTELYTRVSRAHVSRVKSPLDLLVTEDSNKTLE